MARGKSELDENLLGGRTAAASGNYGISIHRVDSRKGYEYVEGGGTSRSPFLLSSSSLHLQDGKDTGHRSRKGSFSDSESFGSRDAGEDAAYMALSDEEWAESAHLADQARNGTNRRSIFQIVSRQSTSLRYAGRQLCESLSRGWWRGLGIFTWIFYSNLLLILLAAVAILVLGILSANEHLPYYIVIKCKTTFDEGSDTDVVLQTISLGLFFFYLISAITYLATVLTVRRGYKIVDEGGSAGAILPCYEIILWQLSGIVILGLILVCSRLTRIPADDSTIESNAPGTADLLSCAFTFLPSVWSLLLVPMLSVQQSLARAATIRASLAALLVAFTDAIILSFAFVLDHERLETTVQMVFWAILTGGMIYVLKKRLMRSAYRLYVIAFIYWTSLGMVYELVRSIRQHELTLLLAIWVLMQATAPLLTMIVFRRDTQYWLGVGNDASSSLRGSMASQSGAAGGISGLDGSAFFACVRELNLKSSIFIETLNTLRQGMELAQQSHFSTRTSVYDVHSMIEEHRKNVILSSQVALQGLVADGATAVVYKGVLRGTDVVAVKVYTALEVTSEDVSHFSKETALNVFLRHPNVVHFYGLLVRPPWIALVFEFCRHGALDTFLQSGCRWDLRAKLKAWVDACLSVAYMHSFTPPLLHRDIKTGNFLITSDFSLKLTDFGEANLLQPRSDGSMTICGTVDFMAPEIIRGTKSAVYGTPADVYSLALTLWQILYPGESPYPNKSHLQVYKIVSEGQRPRIPTSTHAACRNILERAWAQDPKDRPNASDLAREVQALWLTVNHRLPYRRYKPDLCDHSKFSVPSYTYSVLRHQSAPKPSESEHHSKAEPGVNESALSFSEQNVQIPRAREARAPSHARRNSISGGKTERDIRLSVQTDGLQELPIVNSEEDHQRHTLGGALRVSPMSALVRTDMSALGSTVMRRASLGRWRPSDAGPRDVNMGASETRMKDVEVARTSSAQSSRHKRERSVHRALEELRNFSLTSFS